MTNIITELEQRNKQLINEIEVLEKQLENKEEDFKLRIWNAIDNVKESERPEVAGTLMTLEQHFWPKDDWVNVQKENEVEQITFGNNFTLENVVKGFSEWTLINADSFGFTYDKNKKLEEKNALLEKEVAELTPLKEQVESLEKAVRELLLVYQKQEEEGENNWDYWSITELKELTSKVKDQLNEVIFTVIKKWEIDAKCHSESIDTAEEWKDQQAKCLKEEVRDSSELLARALKENEKYIEENKKLWQELKEQKELLRKSQEENENN